MRLAAITVAALASPTLLCGQWFGFVGGTHLTRDFPISRTVFLDPSYPQGLTTFDLFSDTRSFIAGISVELDFGKRFSLEGNALHRTLHLRRRFILPDGSRQDAGRLSVNTWEFPVLLKYRLPAVGMARPFVEAGPAFRTRHNPAPTEPSQIGAAAGLGMEFAAGRFRISPALRYTRWQYDGDFPRFATKRDQIEFLTGLSFGTSVPSWRVAGRKFRFGLAGGTPFTGGLRKLPAFETIREEQGYIAGLAAEVELSRRFSVEANGLYRPFRARSIYEGGPFGPSSFEFTVLTWEFPVLAKYRPLPEWKMRPVVEAGPSFRLSGNRNGYNPSSYGVTAGGGIEADYKAVRIGPVVRYTRWAADSRRGLFTPRTEPNQVELLVSLTF